VSAVTIVTSKDDKKAPREIHQTGGSRMTDVALTSSDDQEFGSFQEDVGSSVDELIRLIAECLPVNGRVYPEAGAFDDAERLRFSVRHSALHFAKTAGQLAAVAEAADHGAEIRIEALRKITANSLVNAFRMAEVVGLSHADLNAFIAKKYGNAYAA
jgi:hypothetical protein